MDSTAISLCMDNNLPICVFDLMGSEPARYPGRERAGTLVRWSRIGIGFRRRHPRRRGVVSHPEAGRLWEAGARER